MAQILSAALSEFAEMGYEGARLDAIAERAGISKPTIYLYFDNKEALFTEVIENTITRTIREASEAVELADGTTEEALRLILGLAYDHFIDTELMSIMRLLIAEGGRFPELLETYHKVAFTQGRALMQGVLRRGVARGDLRPSPAIETPELVIAPAVFLSIYRMTFNRFAPIDKEEFLGAHLDIILNGIRAEEHA
ncbi:TetR/AcrR family transcriptional regulator [Pontivivens ytuae]|uniref:TetR/AcrR family transcriptional regulator n=1 Tax=Pontivivens ytuae TaxID=2789856 RepID=A0A7S9QBS9_9RHOB|nr:TetR/AcrR family transcriptional regulator [Pontivivens ytuae]QPH52657.1 TetR/AcrR family transcriptional regulator [Pontivivens ytuae]